MSRCREGAQSVAVKDRKKQQIEDVTLKQVLPVTGFVW